MSHYEWPKSVLFLRRSCILLTLPRGMVKISGLLKAFLHPSYIATRNDESGVILYLMLHMIKTFLTMTYLMCSLVDGLRVHPPHVSTVCYFKIGSLFSAFRFVIYLPPRN